MDLLVVILSLMHVAAGSLWVGFAVFISFMLGPAIDDAGPGTAGIMPALGRRGIMTVLPVLAMGTVCQALGSIGGVLVGSLAPWCAARQVLPSG